MKMVLSMYLTLNIMVKLVHFSYFEFLTSQLNTTRL
jgi:hypothetical protein